jgi:hypothetical protein
MKIKPRLQAHYILKNQNNRGNRKQQQILFFVWKDYSENQRSTHHGNQEYPKKVVQAKWQKLKKRNERKISVGQKPQISAQQHLGEAR